MMPPGTFLWREREVQIAAQTKYVIHNNHINFPAKEKGNDGEEPTKTLDVFPMALKLGLWKREIHVQLEFLLLLWTGAAAWLLTLGMKVVYFHFLTMKVQIRMTLRLK